MYGAVLDIYLELFIDLIIGFHDRVALKLSVFDFLCSLLLELIQFTAGFLDVHTFDHRELHIYSQPRYLGVDLEFDLTVLWFRFRYLDLDGVDLPEYYLCLTELMIHDGFL